MIARPDELAMQGDINRSKEINRGVSSALSTAAGAGLGAIGASIGSKIMPFLSEYIPSGLAMKGIQKLAPKLGDMLKNGMEQGLDLKEGLDYLKDNIANQGKKNIIEKYDPKLFQALKDSIMGKGLDPARAAIQITNGNDDFFKASLKMEKDTGKPWVDIVSEAFTGKEAERKRKTKADKTTEPHAGPRVPRERSPEIQRIDQSEQDMMQNQQQQPQQQSGGNEALMAAINKIMSM